MKLELKACKVNQGNLMLYLTAMKVRELLSENFYTVERLDPLDNENKGYQRLLNEGRAKKLSHYILDGMDTGDSFLPTSIFLATDSKLDFNEETSTLSIDTKEVDAFSVVDGQHRLEGLRMAALEDTRVLDFEVSVTIADNLNKISQTAHFLIVNTTQKSVDEGVSQRIRARLHEAIDIEDIPTLPRWIRNLVEKGSDVKAIAYVEYLNNNSDSPWQDKIKMANSSGKSGKLKEETFVKFIKKYVLVKNNPLIDQDSTKQKQIFRNYWKAIDELINIDGSADGLYKYNGADLFSKFFVEFVRNILSSGNANFTVAVMKEKLKQAFKTVDGEAIGIGHSAFWKSGGKASGLNSGAITKIVNELVISLSKAENTTLDLVI
ncbi:MAG: DGQHR domain-containing protein [Erysipelotrichales bacterium]|nr:DGQHR domain-containing protein [Erysipelotrichales bacterium]